MKPKCRQQVKKRVYKIFRFKQRFELKEDVRFCRCGPLVFIREYVGSGQDDEAIKYKQQIAICESVPNRCELLYVFWKLREIAANHSRAYRGYLLDERFEPASMGKIAVWVGFDVKKTERIMKQLEQIGLIEQVIKPKFDLSENELPKKKSRNRTRKSSRTHETARARTKKNVSTRGALKRKDKSGSGNRNTKRKIKSDKPEPDKNKNPRNPKGADRGVGQRGIKSGDLPCRSIRIHYKKGPVKLGSIVQQFFRPPECLVFAAEVYKAIGTPYPLDSIKGKSEIGCWESAWSKALLAGLNPVYLQELYNKTIEEAGRLKLKRRRVKFKKSPEAVLRSMFDKMLESTKQKALAADPIQVSAKGAG